MAVFFSDRAYTCIMTETLEKLKTETGGLFLGAYRDGNWYVVEAIDPGPESVFEIAYFEYDQQYTQHLINKIANLYESKLELIGLWHRHPGSFDVFSSTDDGTNSKYARMRSQGAISALVNIDPSFRLTVYHVGRPCIYKKIPFQVGNALIPQDLLRLKSPNVLMKALGGASLRAISHKVPTLSDFMEEIAPLMESCLYTKIVQQTQLDQDKTVDLLINALVGDLDFLTKEIGMEITVECREAFIVLSQPKRKQKLYFCWATSENSALFDYQGKMYLYQADLFQVLYHRVQQSIDRSSPEGKKQVDRTDTPLDNQSLLDTSADFLKCLLDPLTEIFTNKKRGDKE